MNQLYDIANRTFDLIGKPVRLVGYTHGKGVEDVLLPGKRGFNQPSF